MTGYPFDPHAASPPGTVPLYGRALDGDGLPELYETLRREHGPVAPVALAPGVDAWLVLGYPELLRMCRDERDFSHDPRLWNLPGTGRVTADSPLMAFVGWRPAVLFADGAEHRRHRAAVTDALARTDGHELRRTVRAAAEELIAGFAGSGEADLVAHFAQKMTLQVIRHLLGVDGRTGQRMVEAIAGLAAASAYSHDAGRRLADTLRPLVEERRRTPGRDVASGLLRHAASLSDEEVLHNLIVMIVAGNQTVKNWIASTMRLLLTDSSVNSSLSEGVSTVDAALDLVLWRFPPTQNFPARYATRDLRLGDRDIGRGDMLVLGLAAANTDPRVLPPGGCPVPGNRAHVAFGAGPHACPAQDTARLIARTAVETLRHRLPGLALAEPEQEPPWVASPWTRGLAALPVRFPAPGPTTTPPGEIP
jgi:cytochrome P450